MAHKTNYDVKDQQIKNSELRKEMEGCYDIYEIMELRRMRWIDKITKMKIDRYPRKFLIAWMSTP